MELSEAKSLVNELKGRFDSPFNSTDKETIEKLYLAVCGKKFRPTSCQNCYHDALLEVINYIKHHTTMAEKSNFRLKAGAIIHNPTFENGKVFTNDNLTDAVAKAYLNKYPGQMVLFQKVQDGFVPGKKEVPTLEEAQEMKQKAEVAVKGAQTKVENIRKQVKDAKDAEKKAKAQKALEKAEASVVKAQKNLEEVESLIAELSAKEE